MENSPGQDHLRAALRAPGEVAIKIGDNINEASDGLAGDAVDVISDGASWASDRWGDIKEAFSGVNYDDEAQDAYGNRNTIISQFAHEYRSDELSPETMRNMEYLKDAGALEMSGEEGISSRIASGYLDRIQENPSNYGLEVESVEPYKNDQEDVTVYKGVEL